MFFKELYRYKKRKETGLLLLEGIKNINLAKKNKFPILHFFSIEDDHGFQKISKGEMKSITGNYYVTHIAISKPLEYKLNDENIILLDNIMDYGNIGCIIRTAYAFGVKNILYLSDVDLWNHKTIEASRGTIFAVNILKCDLKQFKYLDNQHNWYKIATVMDGTPINQVQIPQNSCIMLGNEKHGLQQELIDLADMQITIPINFESLNVAVTSGIILYKISANILPIL